MTIAGTRDERRTTRRWRRGRTDGRGGRPGAPPAARRSSRARVEGVDAEQQRRHDPPADQRADGDVVRDREAEVAFDDDQPQPVQVLHEVVLVEVELRRRRVDLLLGGEAAEHRACRVARAVEPEAQQHHHAERDDEEDDEEARQSLDDVAHRRSSVGSRLSPRPRCSVCVQNWPATALPSTTAVPSGSVSVAEAVRRSDR